MPHTYERNCVCYVGTHDNAPVLAWREEADAADVAVAERYLGLNDAEGFHWGMIRGGMSSVANLFVAQLQDILGLGAESRMNTPGVSGGNWRWRTVQGALTLELAEKLASMTRLYGRERISPGHACSAAENGGHPRRQAPVRAERLMKSRKGIRLKIWRRIFRDALDGIVKIDTGR